MESNLPKTIESLSSQDWEILTQCMRAAVEDPFFRGLKLSEADFRAISGFSLEECQLLWKYWPNLESPDLWRQYAAVTDHYFTRYLESEAKNKEGTFGPRPPEPQRKRMLRNVDSCFYNLLRFGIGPTRGLTVKESREQQSMAWRRYATVARVVADQVYSKWQQQYFVNSLARKAWDEYVPRIVES